MHKIAFTPLIDLPLAALIVAWFVWHFHWWARQQDVDTSVDLRARLPQAQYRVVCFLLGLVLLCCCLNIAFWFILAILFGIGFAVAVVSGGEIQASPLALWSAAYLIREWAFGFPQFVLHPQRRESRSIHNRNATGALVGKTGVTTSPLRPTGDAAIDGVTYSVVTLSGGLIDEGTRVTVHSYRNGCPCVTPTPEPAHSLIPNTTPPTA